MPSSKSSPSRSKAWHLVRVRSRRRLSPHQRYWYQTAGYVLAALVDGAGYGSRAQLGILYRFASLVSPYLGPAPALDLPRWDSFMTDDHTPIELSWDFHTGADKPTIRYSVEPVALDAGTSANPRNDKAAAEFKKAVVKVFPDTDTTWYNHFVACLDHRWSDEFPEGHPSTVFWAFDLTDKGNTPVTPKAYFFPGTVGHVTKRTNLQVISDAITSAPGYCPEKLSSFHDFVRYSDRHPDLALEMDMLALDLLPVEKSRLKIYFRNRQTSFGSVQDMMSLGGQLRNPDFEEGMRKLRILWDSLLGTEGAPDDEPLPHNGHRTAGILYNVEFRVGGKAPKVKVYIPVRHYAKSDRQVIESVSRFMVDEVAKRPGLDMAEANAKLYSKCMHKTL